MEHLIKNYIRGDFSKLRTVCKIVDQKDIKGFYQYLLCLREKICHNKFGAFLYLCVNQLKVIDYTDIIDRNLLVWYETNDFINTFAYKFLVTSYNLYGIETEFDKIIFKIEDHLKHNHNVIEVKECLRWFFQIIQSFEDLSIIDTIENSKNDHQWEDRKYIFLAELESRLRSMVEVFGYSFLERIGITLIKNRTFRQLSLKDKTYYYKACIRALQMFKNKTKRIIADRDHCLSLFRELDNLWLNYTN